LAATDRAFIPARQWLDTAQFWLDHGHSDFALLSLLSAADELSRCDQPQATALRLEVDQVIWSVSRTL
jgi:hypothetical protein